MVSTLRTSPKVIGTLLLGVPPRLWLGSRASGVASSSCRGDPRPELGPPRPGQSLILPARKSQELGVSRPKCPGYGANPVLAPHRLRG
jgi:hypothetical protein